MLHRKVTLTEKAFVPVSRERLGAIGRVHVCRRDPAKVGWLLPHVLVPGEQCEEQLQVVCSAVWD